MSTAQVDTFSDNEDCTPDFFKHVRPSVAFTGVFTETEPVMIANIKKNSKAECIDSEINVKQVIGSPIYGTPMTDLNGECVDTGAEDDSEDEINQANWGLDALAHESVIKSGYLLKKGEKRKVNQASTV